MKLLRGLCAVRDQREPRSVELAVIAKTAADTIPRRRLRILEALFARAGATAREIADGTSLPETTVRYLLEDLTALRAAEREEDTWRLSAAVRELGSRSGFFGREP